jgi:hypothetical protein
VARGHHDAPSVVWAVIPPLYLIVRCVRFGIGALAPLIAWVVLQVLAAIGFVSLLPTLTSGVLGTH